MHSPTNKCEESTEGVIKDTKSNASFYEVEVATARVEKKYPHLIEDNPMYAIEREEKIEMEIKARAEHARFF
jgi:hypothetical protein